jgi:hypothetical protein
VLRDASAVRVRFAPDLPGQWETPALSWWVDPTSDLAVISIEPVSITAKPDDAPLSPTRFGRIRAEAAVLSVQAVGFPAWKMRNRDGTAPTPDDGKDKYRDACHAVGSAPVLSNSREGTLEIVVTPPGDRPAAGSPWAGMSGAPVWVGDRIVGVLSSQHPADGLSRLAAARLDLALDSLNPDHRAELQTLLPQADQLPDLVNRIVVQSGLELAIVGSVLSWLRHSIWCARSRMKIRDSTGPRAMRCSLLSRSV